MKKNLSILTTSFILLASSFAQPPMPKMACCSATPDRTEWFREARFGMFIHWGVYAVPAGEWKGETMRSIGEWIMRFKKIPVEQYKAYADDFTAEHYDPAFWAELAERAGMKYVVITSKHHDGFALYDSAVSDWDVMNSAAGRDLLAPLAEEVRARGMKFGLYYSQAQDWSHPGGVTGNSADSYWDPAQKGDMDDYLRDIALPQAREIIERYDPAILWWDTPTRMTEERVEPFAELMAKHPHIINNSRLGPGFPGDTSTPERHIPPRGFPGKMFEVCMTMNETWGYKMNDRNWKSSQRLIRMLSDIASKGGNLLLNIGPRADGTIPLESIERLKSIAAWMDINSEAIYATEASPFARRLPWGRVTQKQAPDGGTVLYLHVWEWPEDGAILLPTLEELPTGGELLKNGAPVRAERSPDGVIIHLPGEAPNLDASVAKIFFDGPITVTQAPYATPDAEGVITLGALDADPFGSTGGNIEVEGSGDTAYLTNWTHHSYRLEYRLNAGQTGSWKIDAEVASDHPVQIELKLGEQVRTLDIPATGGGLDWKQLDFGTIELPAEEAVLHLKTAGEDWKPINIRKIRLMPVASK
jgi:alpha-L-fucosidase